jgi:hypothetical protein
MHILQVPFVHHWEIGDSVDQLRMVLASIPSTPIAHVNWAKSVPNVQATVRMGYNKQAFLFQFSVQEPVVKAQYTQSNDPVWQDSCVEIFLAAGESHHYYNFEFNCMGVCLAAYGTQEVASRISASPENISLLKRYARLEQDAHGAHWYLDVVIPFSYFEQEILDTWLQSGLRANFYKCGDGLPQPHYLSWQPIVHPEPNFHLPEYFGELQFEGA